MRDCGAISTSAAASCRNVIGALDVALSNVMTTEQVTSALQQSVCAGVEQLSESLGAE